MSDWQARALVVEQENSALRERIAALEEAMGMMIEVPIALGLGLTPTEGQMLGMLLAREFVPRNAFHIALYQSRASVDDVPEIKIIDVLICKIRAKLKKLCDAKVETKWGEGCFIRPAGKVMLRTHLQMLAA